MAKSLSFLVTVAVTVEPCEDVELPGPDHPGFDPIKQSVAYAISNALLVACGDGFDHPMNEEISLSPEVTGITLSPQE